LINPDKPRPVSITDAYSLEVSAKDIAALTAAAPRMVPAATISIPYRHARTTTRDWPQRGRSADSALSPCRTFLRAVFPSLAELQSFVKRAVAEAGVERCFVIAGDPSTPMGPFPDSSSLIETGVFEHSGIR
jgi:methylenetetrahydrofolate reductase (NADPH)